MNLKEYEALTSAYIEHGGNVEAAARSAGVGPAAARRAVNEGTKNFPPIKQRVESIVRTTLHQSDEARIRHARHFKGAYATLSDQLNILRRIRLRPRGKVNADGTIEVNENVFASLARVTELLAKLGDSALDRSEGRRPTSERGDININMTAQAGVMEGAYTKGLSRRDAYRRSQEILRSNAKAIGDIAGTDSETEFTQRVLTTLTRLTKNEQEDAS